MPLLPATARATPEPAPVQDPRLQLAPPGARARLWLFLLAVALPLALAAACLGVTALRGRHLLLVGGSLPLTVAATLGGIGVATALLWWVLAAQMRRQSLHLDGQALVVRAGFYRCRAPLPELDLEQARTVDLDERPDLRPGRWNGNGFTVPGFHAGWFAVRGHGRAFAAITEGRRVLWLPGRRRPPVDAGQAGFRRLLPRIERHCSLLIEPRDPAALLARLRELAAAPERR